MEKVEGKGQAPKDSLKLYKFTTKCGFLLSALLIALVLGSLITLLATYSQHKEMGFFSLIITGIPSVAFLIIMSVSYVKYLKKLRFRWNLEEKEKFPLAEYVSVFFWGFVLVWIRIFAIFVLNVIALESPKSMPLISAWDVCILVVAIFGLTLTTIIIAKEPNLRLSKREIAEHIGCLTRSLLGLVLFIILPVFEMGGVSFGILGGSSSLIGNPSGCAESMQWLTESLAGSNLAIWVGMFYYSMPIGVAIFGGSIFGHLSALFYQKVDTEKLIVYKRSTVINPFMRKKEDAVSTLVDLISILGIAWQFISMWPIILSNLFLFPWLSQGTLFAGTVYFCKEFSIIYLAISVLFFVFRIVIWILEAKKKV